jgi:hypothetical protein
MPGENEGAQPPEPTIEGEYADSTDLQSQGAEGAQQGAGLEGEGGQPEGTPTATPQYMTREQFDEMSAGLAGQYQERFDQLGQAMNYLAQQIHGLRQPAQPKPQPQQLTPDLPEFDQMFSGGDSYKMHRLMTEREAAWQRKFDELNNQFQHLSGSIQEERLTSQYYNYYKGLVDQAAEAMPVFKDPFAREQLEHYVSASANANRNSNRRIDVMGIAKRMSDHWNKMAEARYQEKIGGQPLPPGQQPPPPGSQQPPPAGTRPPQGTATRPGEPTKREVKDFSDLEAACAEALPGIHAQAAQELGWDKE